LIFKNCCGLGLFLKGKIIFQFTFHVGKHCALDLWMSEFLEAVSSGTITPELLQVGHITFLVRIADPKYNL
jgi:hypothetical protein